MEMLFRWVSEVGWIMFSKIQIIEFNIMKMRVNIGADLGTSVFECSIMSNKISKNIRVVC